MRTMRQINPQRLAWFTMLGALLVFFLLCISLVIFARWLVFESPTNLNVTLYVGKGTVGLAEPDASDQKAIRAPTEIGNNDVVSTDSESQGYVAFSDPYSGQIIATATLHGNSAVTVAGANRPRFSLSENAYVIRLTNIDGKIDTWVRAGLEREVRVVIEGALGTTRIGEAGLYLVTSTPNHLAVTAREGSATLISAGNQAQHISESFVGTVRPDDLTVQITPGPVDIIANSSFDQQGAEWPVGWRCASDLSGSDPNAPIGEYNFPIAEGHSTIHIQRMQPNPGHGETGCVQFLADPVQGLDVSQYDSLHWRVTMRVHYQSLSACGTLGSECPVMLYMKYRDQYDQVRDWYHGFFAVLRPNEGRTICDSCFEPHEQINRDAWYTYESGNLFTDIIADLRPRAIIQVEFYASGHQFEVHLDEVALIATQSTQDTAESAPQ
jgi:hypothetical protein